MCNTLDIWEITEKWGKLQGDVCEPQENLLLIAVVSFIIRLAVKK